LRQAISIIGRRGGRWWGVVKVGLGWGGERL